jgi:hypothetical protein
MKESASVVANLACHECEGTGSFDLFDDLSCQGCGGTGKRGSDSARNYGIGDPIPARARTS